VAFGDNHDEWNFAWAAYAGLAFDVTDAFTVELAYRFLDLGDAQSGDLIGFDGTNNIDNPMKFKNITSHDLKLGVRYTFW
jgi:opacity protein-like surface antigen